MCYPKSPTIPPAGIVGDKVNPESKAHHCYKNYINAHDLSCFFKQNTHTHTHTHTYTFFVIYLNNNEKGKRDGKEEMFRGKRMTKG